MIRDDTQVQIPAAAILEFPASLRVYWGTDSKAKDEKYKEVKKDWAKGVQGSIQEVVRSVTLAVLLAATETKKSNAVPFTQGWTALGDVTKQGLLNTIRDRVSTSQYTPRMLLPEELDRVVYWYQRIHSIDTGKIHIAISRIVRAVGSRSDPEDGFIDAMIALENLLGGKIDNTLRVSVAAAVFLKDEPKERVALRGRIKSLYGKRSNLVHGAETYTHAQTKGFREDTVGVVLDIIRKLLDTHPHLLTSKDRCADILLGLSE